MGDSFSAGTGVMPMVPSPGVTSVCWQSARSYPEIVAAALRVPAFFDETCGSANVSHLTERQMGDGIAVPSWVVKNGPQMDALQEDTSLVTLGIGLNHIPYSELVLTCALTDCRHRYQHGERDILRERIARLRGALAGALATVKTRSPRARVLIVGNPQIVGARGSCLLFTPAETGYVRGVLADLNRALRETALAAGAEYVDLERSSAGRDACRPAGVRWVEPFITSPIPHQMLHANARGAQGAAQAVLSQLGGAPGSSSADGPGMR